MIIASPYCTGEIELIRNAINECGREMVLSLSPGPATLAQVEHLRRYANLWRISGDFWDSWSDLAAAFEKCDQWSGYQGPGHWADADMLPLGHIGIRSNEHGRGDRWTRFTKDEQMTLMTLWCIFRSPLMFGGEMRDNDEWTLSLLTNPEVLRILTHSHSGHQLFRSGPWGCDIAWTAVDEDGSHYLALFNAGSLENSLEVGLGQMGLAGTYQVRDLWNREELGEVDRSLVMRVPGHGARLLRLNCALPVGNHSSENEPQ